MSLWLLQLLKSCSIGEDLIDLINSCNKDGVTVNKRYKSIRTAVLKALREDYAFTKCVIEYPVVFFPDRGLAATGFHLHILEVASEMLLRFKLDIDVALKPHLAYNEHGKRIFSDPCSAMAYESMFNSVQKRFGSDVYPLCIFLSGDEVQLNKKGSLGCKPWYMSIANVRGHLNTSPRNIECIGYSPDWADTKVSVMSWLKYML